MSNYTPITNFTAKDALTTGDANKRILGATIDAETAAIATAITSKLNTSDLAGTYTITGNITFTGTNAIPATGLTGTIADARLSANVPLLNAANTFTALQTITVADGSLGFRVQGATSKVQIYGYNAGNSGGFIRALNAADSLYMPLMVMGNPLRLNPSSGLSADLYLNDIALTDFARLSQANTFTAGQSVTVPDSNQALGLTAASGRLRMYGYLGSTTSAYIDASNLAGSANIDLQIQAAALKLISTGALTLNGVNATDFARLSVNDVFAAGIQVRGGVGTGSLVLDKTGSAVGRFRAFVGDGTGGTTADENYFSALNTAYHFWAGAAGATAVLDISSAGNFDFKAGTVTTNNASASEIGYKGIPQKSWSTSGDDPVLADANKHIYMIAAATPTVTIPANGSVAYPVGTTLTFVHAGAGASMSIAITTDTLYLAGTAFATTGTRTLSRGGMATALKIASTQWLINGAGLS